MPIYNEDGSTAVRDNLFLSTSLRSAKGFRGILKTLELTDRPVLVKPNWFCDLPGQYTDAETLDMFLTALDGQAVIIEGDSYLRNDGSRKINAENADENQDWIREQEQLYLERLGITEVLEKHNAEYINVSEEIYAKRFVKPDIVKSDVAEYYGALVNEELYSCFPARLMQYAGDPLISLARLKVPTGEDAPSLSLKNMFGLIPDPDRSAYHPRIIDAVIDINLLYATYFPVYAVVEGVKHLISPNDDGEFTAPWGKYDDITDEGIAVVGEVQAEVDILAAAIVGAGQHSEELLNTVARRYQSWDPLLPLETRRFNML